MIQDHVRSCSHYSFDIVCSPLSDFYTLRHSEYCFILYIILLCIMTYSMKVCLAYIACIF